MGAYLNHPEKDVTVEEGDGGAYRYAVATMQGWRTRQEDAHAAIPNFDTEKGFGFFGVFDGHGGPEVALYCSKMLPEYIKSMPNYGTDPLDGVLRKAFVQFDNTLKNESVIELMWSMTTSLKVPEKDAYDADNEQATQDSSAAEEDATTSSQDVGQQAELGADEIPEASDDDATATTSDQVNPEADTESQNDDDDEGESPRKATNGQELDVNTKKPEKQEAAHPKEPLDETKENVGNVDSMSSDTVTPEVSPSKGKGKAVAEKLPVKLRSSKRLQNLIGSIVDRARAMQAGNLEDSSSGSESDEYMEGTSGESGSASDSTDEEWADEEEEEDDMPGISSGCTAVVALLGPDKVTVANIGDSRAILGRIAEKDGLLQIQAVDLSVDHKPEQKEEMDRIVNAGGVVDGEGRIDGGLNLSRAFGDHNNKNNEELPPEAQKVIAVPDIMTEAVVASDNLSKGDKFLFLACDGIWNVLSSQDAANFIWERIIQGKKLSDILKEGFDHCLAPDCSGDGTGCDNMTAILIVFRQVQFNAYCQDDDGMPLHGKEAVRVVGPSLLQSPKILSQSSSSSLCSSSPPRSSSSNVDSTVVGSSSEMLTTPTMTSSESTPERKRRAHEYHESLVREKRLRLVNVETTSESGTSQETTSDGERQTATHATDTSLNGIGMNKLRPGPPVGQAGGCEKQSKELKKEEDPLGSEKELLKKQSSDDEFKRDPAGEDA